VVTEELSKFVLAARLRIMDSVLQVLCERFVEFVIVFLVFSNLIEEFKGLLDNVLANDLQDLVLLKGFTRNVKREILRVNNSLNESEPLRDQLLTVISDEDTTNVELNIVHLLSALEHVEWSPLGYEKDSTEFKLTLNREVLDSQVVLPIVSDALVESSGRK
jgi:hypothetical protein